MDLRCSEMSADVLELFSLSLLCPYSEVTVRGGKVDEVEEFGRRDLRGRFVLSRLRNCFRNARRKHLLLFLLHTAEELLRSQFQAKDTAVS